MSIIVRNASNGTGSGTYNWSADDSWRVQYQDGVNLSTSSGTNNASIASGVVSFGSAPENWVADALIGHRFKYDGTYYTIADNDTTTVTLADPPGDSSDKSWAVGGKPLKGEFALVQDNVVWDCDIGASGAGNGVKRIDVHHATAGRATFLFDAAANRTLYFGSSGTDPVGSTACFGAGSAAAATPGSDATMFGIHVGRGSINLEGSATNKLTITSEDDSSPWYADAANNLGDLNHARAITLKYAHLKHVGTNADRFYGIYTGSYTASMALDHVLLEDPYQVYVSSHCNSYALNAVTVTGCRSSKTFNIEASSANAVGFTITDVTELAPAADGTCIYFLNRPSNLTITAPAVYSTTQNRRTLAIAGNGTATAGSIVQQCLWSATKGSGWANGTGINWNSDRAAADNVVQDCVGWDGYQSICPTGAADMGITFKDSFIRETAVSKADQGAIFTASGVHVGNGNIVLIDNSVGTPGSSFGFFTYNNATMTIDHNTVAMLGTIGSESKGIVNGDGLAVHAVNMIERTNIVYGFDIGIEDFTCATRNTYVQDYASAGVHHNNVYGQKTKAYDDNGGTNFDDGTHQHPDAETYGDLSVDPQFVDTTRTLASWDTSLGGAGSVANVFDMLGCRCGFPMTLNSSYDDAWNVADLLTYLRDGFKVQAAALENAGHDGETIGACDYQTPPATAYTLAGPTPASGNVDEVSDNFTVAPNGVYTGSIVPHSTGAGTFSPTILTWVAESGAKTFTYTPASAASSPHEISTTSDPQLGDDPAAVEYTVEAEPAAAGGTIFGVGPFMEE